VYSNYDSRVAGENPERPSRETALLLYAPEGIYHVRGGFHHVLSPADMNVICEQIDAEAARVVLGHFSFGLHRGLARETTYVTMLRDPVERVVSLYHHHLRFQDDTFGVISRQFTLAEFASLPEIANDQSRRLSGLDPTSIEASVVLHKARHNLHTHFGFVGISERFDESVVLLSRMFNWPNVHYRSKLVNRAKPATDDLPREAIGAVAEANALDLQLIEYCRQLFEERVAAEGQSFARAVEDFRESNRKYLERLARTAPSP
jgi:hypothetical protein